MMQQSLSESEVYQGQFGEFSITQGDRQGVLIYRAGLVISALSFAIGSALIFWKGTDPAIMTAVTVLYACFCVGLGVSLLTIHIYLLPLHRLLQAFWAIGTVASLLIAFQGGEPLALTVYHYPMTLLGIGFAFAALTGIFFKEAFCFNRLETKLLTPLVPILLVGHLVQGLPVQLEQDLLALWAGLYLIFALRKTVQSIPADIGDKSVFAYLQQHRSAHS
jgi:uncharacterized integral membrane protein